MSERSSDEPRDAAPSPATRWGQINDELRRLEGREDPESRARFHELLDELMCADMALQPERQAMCRRQGGGRADADTPPP